MVENQPMWKYAINHFANFTKFMIKLICIAELFCLFVCGRPDLYSQFDQRNAFLTHIDYFDTIFMLFPIHYSNFDYSNCNFGKPGWFCFW